GNVANNADFNRKKTQFWIDEGVAAVLDLSRGDGGTFFVQSPQGISREPNGAAQPPQVTLNVEHYGRIYRTLEKKIPVTLQVDIDNKFFDQDLNAFNIVAEIPGTDRADEVVMVGAHFDSWHGGTGATDNAAGSAVRMEALTIRNTGGTDHLSYDAVGLPGFQFIQDDVEYNSRTHHSNMDVYERIQPQDMMRNAVIVASFVYNTANRDEKLPRKPLPKPTPPAGRGTSSQP